MATVRPEDYGILAASKTVGKVGGASFTLANRIERTVWIVVWTTLASWTPPQCHGLRRWLLRLFGAKIAKGARIYSSVRIWRPANLAVGEAATIGPRVIVYNQAPVIIGACAVVSQGAHLCTGSHKVDDPTFQLFAKPIEIGSKAWIAAEAFVGPGVRVGEGAVLGARAVAFAPLKEWTVYTGNPAFEHRKRKQ